MKQTNEIKYAYAAGFIDGEGCIRISKRNPRNNRSISYNLLMMIFQKDGQIMDWLIGNFGGLVYKRIKDEADQNTYGHGWVYEWRLSERQAYELLKKLVPFLKYKKPQAELAIRFYERRIFENKNKRDNNKRFIRLTDEEINKREEIYQQMKSLKKIYHQCKYPNVVELKTIVQE